MRSRFAAEGVPTSIFGRGFGQFQGELPAGAYGFVQASNYNMFFHSDAETPATVPAPGLAATTRAYAKIVEDVNKMELKDLQMPAPRRYRNWQTAC